MSNFNLHTALADHSGLVTNELGDTITIQSVDLTQEQPIKAVIAVINVNGETREITQHFYLDGSAFADDMSDSEDLLNIKPVQLKPRSSVTSNLQHIGDLQEMLCEDADFGFSDADEILIEQAMNILQGVVDERIDGIDNARAYMETDEYHRAILK